MKNKGYQLQSGVEAVGEMNRKLKLEALKDANFYLEEMIAMITLSNRKLHEICLNNNSRRNKNEEGSASTDHFNVNFHRPNAGFCGQYGDSRNYHG